MGKNIDLGVDVARTETIDLGVDVVPTATLQEAVELVRILQPCALANGLALGVTGSTLYAGVGHDIDILVYPLKTVRTDVRLAFLNMQQYLHGFENWENRTPYHEGDLKQVYKAYLRSSNRLVDFILVD